MKGTSRTGAILLLATVILPTYGVAQEESRRERHEGSAVVREKGGDAEYKIRIECDDASRPELGFTTEPNRVTREATGGKYNMVNLRLRPWKETDDVLITSPVGVAWIPRPTSTGGVLSLSVDVVPGKWEENGQPVLLTYDMWKEGVRPEGGATVEFEATCGYRDPEAPSYRRLTNP